MEFNDVIKNRYSVRKFTDEKVSQALINEILETGRLAPSGNNNQPTIVYVLDEEKIGRLKESAKTKETRISPAAFKSKQAFLICYDKTKEVKRPTDKFAFGITDSSIVTTYMMLKITELGLGSVWVGYFNPVSVKETLEISDNHEVSAILTFGHIHKNSKPDPKSGRKPIENFKMELASK
ncbi:MAG: nitroreductase family protein [Defluviitaleaceae bacterium]|nr:nitroreductase family protein [Defluviitaleaceae bacterium]